MLLSDIVHFGALRRPRHPAVYFGDRVIGYEALSVRIRRVANAFGGLAPPGDRVAIVADNSPEYLECLYGLPEAGLIATLVNQRLAPPEVGAILSDAEPSVVVVGSEHRDRLADVIGSLPTVQRTLVIGGDGEESYEAFVGRGTAAAPNHRPDEDAVAWLIFTSGTTGRPKGAMLTHRNIMTGILNSALEWHPGRNDVVLFVFPLCHVAAYVPLLHHLQTGTVVLGSRFDPGEFLALIERHRVTHAGLAPTMINFLLRDPACATADVSSIRMMPYGASSIAPDLLARAMQRFGPVFVQGYGMTELAGNVLVLPREVHERGLQGEPGLLAAAGRPNSLCAVRVVDDKLDDVAVGEVGEIVVRGDQVTPGYWQAEEATAEAFAGGWFHTGDLARMDDEGLVYVVDRKKDMIVSGGENVYPRDVEDVLAKHPGVVEAAVIGTPDPVWGEMVTAVVVPNGPGSITAADVTALCRGELGGYKIPRRVVFLDALPRNAAGKVLKQQLREYIGSS